MGRTPRQKVILLLTIWCSSQVVLFIGLFVIEVYGVSVGDRSTISRFMWGLWATEPWVPFIATHTMAAPWWFLLGHFFAQRRDVYQSIREGKS